MIKSFKIDYNGVKEIIEYEDDITFGELENILNQCLDMTEVNKPIALKSGLHPISVKYFQEGGSNGLNVSWKGPGFDKQEIPSSVLFH